MSKRNVANPAHRVVVVFITGVIALFLISVSYAFYAKKNTEKDTAGVVVVREDDEVIASAYQKDSDGDGLADWEELLWDMDPQNPDTDGDGVPDKKDIMEARLSTDTQFEKTSSSSVLSPSGSDDSGISDTTEVMAHELFGNYMYSLQQDGVTLSEEKRQELVDGALETVSPVLQPPRYSISDVTTVPATQENRLVYIGVVRDKLQKMTAGATSEHEAIYAIGQGNVDWATTELKKTTAQYTLHLNELKNIPVPSDAVAIHAHMVQALMFYVYTLEGFAAVKGDPLRAAASAKVFVGAERLLKNSYEAMRAYIEVYYPDIIQEGL